MIAALLRLFGWVWSVALVVSVAAVIVGSFWGVRVIANRDNHRLRKENARLRGNLLHPLREPIEEYESVDAFLRATIGTAVRS